MILLKLDKIFIIILLSWCSIVHAKDDYSVAFTINENEKSTPLNMMSIVNKLGLIQEKQKINDADYYSTLYEQNNIVYYDPWIKLNRKIFLFNHKVDDLFMLKIVDGYSELGLVTKGAINNFVCNWNNTPLHILYSIIQLDIESVSIVFWRFMLNSTMGFFGIYDIAGELGLRKPEKSIDQTLAYYNIPRGPYIILPFYGPNTITNSIEIPLIIAMNLYSPYGIIGLPLNTPLMYSWLGNTSFSYTMSFTSLLLPTKYLYYRSNARLLEKDSKDISIDSYELYKDTYMSLTNFTIDKENENMAKGRFKAQKPLMLSHHQRIGEHSMEGEFELKNDLD